MKRHLLKGAALLSALILLCLCTVSCGAKRQTLVSLEANGKTYTLPVNAYELFLTRMRGSIASAGYRVEGNDFWDSYGKFGTDTLTTNEEYYNSLILGNCKTYLAVMALCDKYGVTLTEAQKDGVEDLLNELVVGDGDGSKTKLNSILAAYGVNYGILKDCYLLEEKITALEDYLYTHAMDDVLSEYLNGHYVRFRQVVLSNVRYVYETDANGDEIYYQTENGAEIYYDRTGFRKLDKDGLYLADDNGDDIFFTDETYTRVKYNTVQGVRHKKAGGDGSVYETTEMSAAELAQLQLSAEALYGELKNADDATFEAVMREKSDDTQGQAEYTDGYYLQSDVSYAGAGEEYFYLDQIVDALRDAGIGETVLVSADDGYHVVRKYAPSDRAWKNEINEIWFRSFAEGFAAEQLTERCREYEEKVTVNEDVLAAAPSIREVATNYFY